MAFEPVDSKGQRDSPRELRIHSSTGTGYLTVGAVREWFQHTARVTLYVDREHSKIGINRGPGEEGDTYKLSGSGGGDGTNLTVTSALRSLDIDPDGLEENYVLQLKWNEEESLVVADATGLVEAETGAVHREECGKRCADEAARKSHYTKIHDENYSARVLEETDPDEIGEPIPPKPGAEGEESDA